MNNKWWPTSGLVVSIIGGMIIFLLGILTGQLQPAALALVLLLGSGWIYLRRPRRSGSVTLSTRSGTTSESRVGAIVAWQPAPEAEALRIRTSAPGHRAADTVVAAPNLRKTDERRVQVSIRTARTGRRPIFTVDQQERYGDHMIATDGDTEGPLPITVLPRAGSLKEVPLPYRLSGLTGPHDSRRAGEGNDLRDINLFTPGDRLRRIDWRVTARRNTNAPIAAVGTDTADRRPMITDLYVRRSYATADAAIMLVLDSRDEVGPDLTTWNDSSSIAEDVPTSLDNARAAALTLARRYLRAGDRVGLEDLGRMRRPIPPAGGQRQLQRLSMRIALAEPEGEPRARHRPPRMPSGALIIVCSTFLDDETWHLAQLWHGSGHRVLAVDVLGEPDLRNAPRRLVTAYRIIDMERRDRLSELARSGVEVIHWTEAGQHPVQVALAALTRKRVRR
jgi:uncharacterized protein (DUF58 family)